ncbi:cation transporting ATPase C-terminal domain-containing protein [Streptomyces sp. NPDC001307]|uniref:cation transporting ATPase C-terminal domain-containing protein n=1 Tax=Streptomyces sp. NPDC001307 TaxID=3364560 RepID=UPI00368CDECC
MVNDARLINGEVVGDPRTEPSWCSATRPDWTSTPPRLGFMTSPRYGSVAAGQSMAFTSFALCLIVAALEYRSETDTVLITSSFDSKQMNWAMLIEFFLAVFVTQMDSAPARWSSRGTMRPCRRACGAM